MQLFTFPILTGENQLFLRKKHRGNPIAGLGREESITIEGTNDLINSGRLLHYSVFQIRLSWDEEPVLWGHILKEQFIYPTIPPRKFADTVMCWQKKNPWLRGYRMLYAHGNTEKGRWRFGERDSGTISRPVQDWIDEYDGSALALIILCCNPQDEIVTARRSIVIHLNKHCRSIDAVVAMKDQGLRLYLPHSGYVT